MNEDEKKKRLIEELKIIRDSEYGLKLTSYGADFILNLIEKQQKEIEKLKEALKKVDEQNG